MSQPTALIIDDSTSSRFVLSRYLDKLQWQSHAAATMEDALRFLQTTRPDLIFADYRLPDVEPTDLLNALAAQPASANVPVIVCVTDEPNGFIDAALAQGAAAVLEKPVTFDQLTSLLGTPSSGMEEEEEEVSYDTPPPPPAFLSDEPEAFRPPAQAPSVSVAAIEADLAPMSAPLTEDSPPQGASFAQTLPPLLAPTLPDIAVVEVRNPIHAEASSSDPATSATNEGSLEARIASLEARYETEIERLRQEMRQTLKQQLAQIEQLREALLGAAVAAAQSAAEQTVTAAAAQMSDRLAASILQSLKSRD
jgi:CheY-like chemotaxis protein